MIGTLKGILTHKQPPWLLVDVNAQNHLPASIRQPNWQYLTKIRRPTDDNETLLIFRRVAKTTDAS